ncbi:PLP-dependent aminotransferase family protein [Pseudotabrizicola sp. 4114]|uniref:aminotransferase-like domain-containing protein n=1 Tax=Pseudotabrizicola sp. 4114 TaxID=2817731 RepID=UPI002857D6A8|nr:DNA-binding transcriptional MocR family regulator [Pseudorhodobacter sp. 4114]
MADTIWLPKLSDADGPKYLALTRALRESIRSGELETGAQLPTVRELAWQLKVTPGTVARAYSLATQEGMLAATVGRGTFVAASAPRLGPTQALFVDRDPARLQGKVDLRAPILPDVGQNAAIGAALRAIGDDPDTNWVDYPSQQAELPLREAICDWISERVLGTMTADDIVLTHGGQNAINLIFMCCLRGDRPVVLTEELAYPGFRHAARLSRAEVVAVEMDAEGILPEALEQACRRYGAQVLCLTGEAQNPTTGCMGLARRQAIVDIARRYDLQIIDDDCYSVASGSVPALRALAPERVWHVGSLSKSISAGLRFGYIVAPTGMGPTGRLTAQHSFFALSRPVEAVVLHLLQSGEARRLRGLVQAELEERLQFTVNALGAFDLGWQPGLQFIFLRLPSGWRASSFCSHAEAAGVIVRSADEYALIHGRAPNAVRVALAGNVPMARFEEGIMRLARLLAQPPAELMV